MTLYALTDPSGDVIRYPYTPAGDEEGVVEVVDTVPPMLDDGQTLDEAFPINDNGVYLRNWIVHDWLLIVPDGLYARVVDGGVAQYPYTLNDLRRDWPETVFPSAAVRQMDGEWGVVSVEAVDGPVVPEGQVAVEITPALSEGEWHQQWELQDIPPEPVPQVVTMRQARLALLAAGLLGAVETAIDALPSPDKEAAQIEWEYAMEVNREWPLINSIGSALGLDDAAIDALFIAASKL